MMRVIESGNYITIQRSIRETSPTLKMNLQVKSCVPIHNGIQFHLNGGYINVEFNDYIDEKKHKYRTYELEFDYDDDRPRGYRVRFEEFSLFIPEVGFEELLKNLDKEVAIQRQRDKERQIIRDSADRYIDKATWASIDNMLEN